MPEAGPHNTEYTQHHPKAILDRDKSEVVARATKRTEEAIVSNGAAIDGLLDEHADSLNSGGNHQKEREIKQGLEVMEANRRSADSRAKEVGQLYDDTQEELARLKGK